MLLRNYYSSLTYSAIGNTNVTEDVARELSPRYSRLPTGTYALVAFPNALLNASYPATFFYGVSTNISGARCIGFGSNETPTTFNDYAPVVTSGLSMPLSSTRVSSEIIYDDITKTYTLTELYTLTNTTNKNLVINEILLGGLGGIISTTSTQLYVTRDLLGNNSFTISGNESVKFELTVKYTIAEPLQ